MVGVSSQAKQILQKRSKQSKQALTGISTGPLGAGVRSFVRARAVVVYWFGLTEHLMAAGGAADRHAIAWTKINAVLEIICFDVYTPHQRAAG